MSDKGSVRFAVERGFFSCGNDIFKLDLPAIEKLIYIALNRYAGANNRAWPAYDTLARDASCSKRRAISAVETLCQCNLVQKQTRGNRTNVYLVYPPNYFKKDSLEKTQGAVSSPQTLDAVSDNAFKGESPAPQETARVNEVHPEGDPGAPSGCTQITSRVNTDHPISNKNNTRKSNNSSSENDEEREINSKNIKSEDIKEIKEAFKAKGVDTKVETITELLNSYPVKDIKAAIKSTDFNSARNPISVIKWMLKEGNYVLPIEAKTQHPDDHDPDISEDDVVAIKSMIQDTKKRLLNKTNVATV